MQVRRRREVREGTSAVRTDLRPVASGGPAGRGSSSLPRVVSANRSKKDASAWLGTRSPPRGARRPPLRRASSSLVNGRTSHSVRALRAEGRVPVAREWVHLALCTGPSRSGAHPCASGTGSPGMVDESITQKGVFPWLENGFTSHGARALHAAGRIPVPRERLHPAGWTSPSRRRARSCGSGMGSPGRVDESFTQKGAFLWLEEWVNPARCTSPLRRSARPRGSGTGLPRKEYEPFTHKEAFPRLGDRLTSHGARAL